MTFPALTYLRTLRESATRPGTSIRTPRPALRIGRKFQPAPQRTPSGGIP
jgi:hypothetical protein